MSVLMVMLALFFALLMVFSVYSGSGPVRSGVVAQEIPDKHHLGDFANDQR